MATCTTVNESAELQCRLVDLELDLTDRSAYTLHRVLTRPCLNINASNVVRKEELAKWPHLSDLEIQEALPGCY